jgi:hypothetical protein
MTWSTLILPFYDFRGWVYCILSRQLVEDEKEDG